MVGIGDKEARSTSRYPKMKMSVLSLNTLSLRNPFIVMWWSAAIPGFGHMMLGKYTQGFILVVWEFINNQNGHLNTAIYLSMIGDFAQAKQVLDQNWIALYVAVYVFNIWDSYTKAIDLNKMAVLAGYEPVNEGPINMTSYGINYLRRYQLWIGMLYSLFMPGLGQIYLQRLVSGLFLIIWWVLSCYYSHFMLALHDTMMGQFARAIKELDPQWLLYMPSIYVYAVYEVYIGSKHLDYLYRAQQAEYLCQNYQEEQFRMPL